MLPVLEGVVMELQDCALPLLRGKCLVRKTCLNNMIAKVSCQISCYPFFKIVFWIFVWKRHSLNSKLIEELMYNTKKKAW